MKKRILNILESSQVLRKIPYFKTGYILEIKIWVVEGNKKRIQSFEGIVISFRKRGLNSSFTIRKISYGEGVERVFPLYSPNLHEILVKKKVNYRKSKLYYLRNFKKK